mmetsp:Transcript_10544/g.29791  ORF Transcript_10544/g.29791 Transcript_10544/m.29791 type:complete len:221 (-) Transcript_10544:1841-2503(-)
MLSWTVIAMLRYITATTWQEESSSRPQPLHQLTYLGSDSHRSKMFSRTPTRPMTTEMIVVCTMFHLRGSSAGLQESFEVAIAVKSFTRLSRIKTHVGKSNWRATMDRKKNPRMSTELAIRYSTYPFSLLNIFLDLLIAVMMVERPGALRTISDALLAASVAPATAIPTLALFKAGASLTPSPVIPQMWPIFCSSSTILNLCSGKTEANPLTCSMKVPKEP